MLSRLRHLLIDSWLGRILVGLIFLVFISWGAETIIESWSQRDGNVVAWVGSQRVTIQELDSAANAQLAQYAAQQGFSDPSQVPNVMRSTLVNQALQQLIIEKNLLVASEQAGLIVSDDALRNLVFSLPMFQTNGKFDRELFNSYIRQANIPEARFLDMLRNQLALSGLTEPVTAGATTSDIMSKAIFGFRNETRQLSFIQVPFNQFKPEATPSDAVLKRYYNNHLWEFTVPEYRRIKMIFFTPETVEKSVETSDEEALKYYNSRKPEFNKPESRNLEIVTVKDKVKAEITQARAKQKFVDNVKSTQDILAGGAGMDDEGIKLLGGKGIVAVQGTLNEQGLTLEGQPAPIPPDDKVRQAILGNIFSKAKNAQPSLIQGENNIYYAFVVEDIMPAHQESFEQGKERVIAAWQQANIKRQADIAVTAIFKQAQDSNKSVQELGNQQFSVKESEAFSRVNPSKTLPAGLQGQAFLMQLGQTTMLESPEGFYVATLNNIKKPEPQDDQVAYSALKNTLKQADSNDIYNSYVIFINNRGKVDVNQKAVDIIIGKGSN